MRIFGINLIQELGKCGSGRGVLENSVPAIAWERIRAQCGNIFDQLQLSIRGQTRDGFLDFKQRAHIFSECDSPGESMATFLWRMIGGQPILRHVQEDVQVHGHFHGCLAARCWRYSARASTSAGTAPVNFRFSG